MQIKSTFKKFSGVAAKIFVLLLLATGSIHAQTLTTAGGTNYLGDYSVSNNTTPLTVSFVIQNTTAAPLALTGVSTQLGPWTVATAPTPAGTPVISKLYYSATSLSGNYDLSTAAWTQIATGSAVVPAVVTVTQVITGINFIIPANTEYRFAVEASRGLRFSFSPTPTPNVFSVGGVNLKVGNNQIAGLNIGYAGLYPMPAAGNTPAFFGGTVTLVSTVPCTGTPAPGNTVSTAASVCAGVPFTLSPQNNTTGSGVTYQWQSSATGAAGSFANIAGATSSNYTVSNLGASTYYQVVVACSGNTGTTAPLMVSLTPTSGCYCIPANSDCTDDDVIENVRLGSLNKASACSATGYSNYTATDTATAIRGASNPIFVTTGDSWTEQVGVWIDYDRNGTFDASEFTNLGSTAAGSGGVHTGAILVPATALTGYTRMRVRVRFSAALTGANACLAYTYGETEDYTVNITPCVVSTVTTQPPATRTISCSGTGTITATIAGSLNQYQWQVLATGAGAVWTDLANNATYSGVTTSTLTITNALPSITGYQYRVRYVGACTSPSVTTATTLTVGGLVPTVSNTLPINRCSTAAPTAISIATPVGLASLSTTASGAVNINIPDNNDETIGQNTNFISSNLAVNNIPAGATITGFNVKLNITHSWVGDLILVLKAPNGKIINLAYALTGTGGVAASTGFTNTVISSTGTAALSSGTNPYTATFRLDNAGPSTTGFTPTGPLGFNPNTTALADMYQGNGTWTLALYDYYEDGQTTNVLKDWELNITYTGQTTAVFSPSAGLFTDAAGTIAYTGQSVNTVYANPAATTTYSATVTTAVCGAGTVSIPVNVGSPLSGNSTVANKIGCVGGNVTFSSTAPTGGANATYQWQISTDAGVTWTNIAGATASDYTVNAVTTAMTGNRYRVVRTVAACTSTLTSSAGTLTVGVLPTLTISANPSTTIYPGQTTTIAVASSTTTPANGYTWYRDGVIVPNQNTNTLVVGVDELGTYTVQVADANGCSATSLASIAVTAAANDRLFIYPSPSTGQFQVRYFSEFGSTVFPRTVNVYDSKGSRVYTRSYSITSPYTRIDVNLDNHPTGIYTVELTDYNGNRIKTGRVVIL